MRSWRVRRFVLDLDAADFLLIADGKMGNSAAVLAEIGDMLDAGAYAARSTLHASVAPEALDFVRDEGFSWGGHGQLLSFL